MFICNYRFHWSPAPAFLVGCILHMMVSSPVPQPGKPMESMPPLLEHSLLPLSLYNRKIKNFPWMWHQELQIPSLGGSSGAAVCVPFLGTSPGQDYSLFMGWASCREDRRWRVIPSQMLRRYKWLPTDLCQLKTQLDYTSWFLYSPVLCCSWTQEF